MIQIVGYLLCVYLVFKGLEIFQIAWVNGGKRGLLLGILALSFSVLLAILFGWWLTEQGSGRPVGSI